LCNRRITRDTLHRRSPDSSGITAHYFILLVAGEEIDLQVAPKFDTSSLYMSWSPCFVDTFIFPYSIPVDSLVIGFLNHSLALVVHQPGEAEFRFPAD